MLNLRLAVARDTANSITAVFPRHVTVVVLRHVTWKSEVPTQVWSVGWSATPPAPVDPEVRSALLLAAGKALLGYWLGQLYRGLCIGLWFWD